MNKIKNKEQNEKTVGAARKVTRSFIDVINGNVLTREYVVRNIPFLVFLTFLMLTYIGLGYFSSSRLRKIENLKSEIIELKSEYLSTSTELNMISGQKQIADSTAAMGLTEKRDHPPRVIQVDKKTYNKIY
jgi:hypothetical protein